MMDQFEELLSVGKEIMDSVNRAVEGNDFSSLSKDINVQVVNLTEELNKYNARVNGKRQNRTSTATHIGGNQKPQYQRPAYIQQNTTTNRRSSKYTNFKQVTPGYGKNVLKIVFGAIGICFFAGLVLTSTILLSVFGGAASIPSFIVSLAGGAGSGFLVVQGIRDRKLIDKFYKYANLVGVEEYISIAKLASMANESESTVLSNLEKMMDKGYLPKARLDAEKKTLMLTNDVYKQYLQTTEQKMRERQLQSQKEDEIDKLNVSKEVKEIMRNGQMFVDKIQKYNDAIPDETMTSKLDDLKQIVNRIFDQVKKNPRSAGDMRKFMNYYLPTTEKLLNAYIDLDKQPGSSSNIVKTKKEIEGAIDTINEAFNNMFDSMFEDVAWDISSDISAMKTMMAQDGLTEPAVKRQTLM